MKNFICKKNCSIYQTDDNGLLVTNLFVGEKKPVRQGFFMRHFSNGFGVLNEKFICYTAT